MMRQNQNPARHVSAGLRRRLTPESRQGWRWYQGTALTMSLLAAFLAALASGPISPAAWSQTAPRTPQTAPRVVVRDVTFHSASLARDMKYRIVLPADYERTSRRYPVLYLLHGLTGHYEDWESRTHLDDYVANLPLIVAMPEGGDSWYTNSASQPQEKWEDYIVKDLLHEIDSKYRTIQTRHARAIAGLSMGGYGAMKFALKFPGTFAFAVSFSGAEVVVHDPSYKISFGQKYVDQIHDIFGDGITQPRIDNDIFELAKKRAPAQLPYLVVTCGTEDSLLASNREFVALVQQLKIRYEYHESPGAHTWQYWDEQLPYALSLLMDRFFREPARSKLRLKASERMRQ